MRPADTDARGRKMNIIDIIKNENTICMAYCMKAIISPTCICAWATWCDPIQMISSDSAFMITIIEGNMPDMTRLTNRVVPVSSRLALSKRCSSKGCMLKARITSMPDRFSRTTRFSRSISVCITLNLGSDSAKTTATSTSSSATAAAISHHMDESLLMTRKMPPTPMMGA